MSGVIAAQGNNEEGISGICWHAGIMSLRIVFTSDRVAAAIDYAKENGGHIINMSFRSLAKDEYGDGIVKDALDAAYEHGLLLVASAANDNLDINAYPASLYNVMAVGSTDWDDKRSGFSSYGLWVDLAAPGSEILSTFPVPYDEIYNFLNGTSFSSPYTAGVGALLLSYDPTLTNVEVRAILENTTDPLQTDYYIGTGRLNASNVLSAPGPVYPLGEIVSPVKTHFLVSEEELSLIFLAYGDHYTLEYKNYDNGEWIVIGQGDPEEDVEEDGFIHLSLSNPGRGKYIARLTTTKDSYEHVDSKIFYVNLWNWEAMESGTDFYLQDVWGSSATDVFAVGGLGFLYSSSAIDWDDVILHYDGNTWEEMENPEYSGSYLNALWGSSATDVYAVGWGEEWTFDFGIICHYDGSEWSLDTYGMDYTLKDIWGSSPTDIFVVGSKGWDPDEVGKILHYDGASWSEMYSTADYHLNGVWGSSATDVYAVGGWWDGSISSFIILHYDGASWSEMYSGTGSFLNGVWGSSATDVYVVGSSESAILHYDGDTWSEMESGADHPLRSVWCNSPTDIYAVGYYGTILGYDGNTWLEMGSGVGTSLNSVYGVEGNIFVGGGDGTILRGGTNYFVDNVNGNNNSDGLSWGTALMTIGRGIELLNGKIGIVHVAAGVYDENITLTNGLALLGGYPVGGGERDPKINETIIDGGGRNESVITGADNAAIDGFTIRNGKGCTGGGVYCNGTSPTIMNNMITLNNNSQDCGWDGVGGGIYVNNASPTIIDNLIENNTSLWAGGIAIMGNSFPTIDKNTILSNTAVLIPGGIYINESSSPHLANNIIANNSASCLGGIGGGGILVDHTAAPSIINNTIVNNSVDCSEGDGIYITGTTPAPTIKNNILWGNGDDLYGASSSMISYCDIEDGDFNGENGNISLDPILDSTYHLTPYSPCINSGTGEGAPADDIDGNPRPSEDKYDIGADEYEYLCPDDSYWKFDEGPSSSLVIDYISDNNGTRESLHGSTYIPQWHQEAGIDDWVLQFNASNACGSIEGGWVKVEDNDDGSLHFDGSFTLEAWVKPDDQVDVGANIIKKYCTSSSYHLGMIWSDYYHEGDVYFMLRAEDEENSTSITASDNPISKDVWNHVVAVRDAENQKMKLYINGVPAVSEDYNGGEITGWLYPLYIGGGCYATHGCYYKGLIDDVAIYKRALIDEEVELHYNAGRVGSLRCGE